MKQRWRLVTDNRPMANIKPTPTFLREDRFNFMIS